MNDFRKGAPSESRSRRSMGKGGDGRYCIITANRFLIIGRHIPLLFGRDSDYSTWLFKVIDGLWAERVLSDGSCHNLRRNLWLMSFRLEQISVFELWKHRIRAQNVWVISSFYFFWKIAETAENAEIWTNIFWSKITRKSHKTCVLASKLFPYTVSGNKKPDSFSFPSSPPTQTLFALVFGCEFLTKLKELTHLATIYIENNVRMAISGGFRWLGDCLFSIDDCPFSVSVFADGECRNFGVSWPKNGDFTSK